MKFIFSEQSKDDFVRMRNEHIQDYMPQRRRGAPPSRAGISSDYDGPFAVVQKDDTNVTAESNDGYIILGTSTVSYANTDVEITSNGRVYLEITFNGSAYAVSAKFASSLPAQDETHIYHPLAYVTFADSVISGITQLQYGIIHFPSRFL